jgi:hypothetical protein
VAIDHDVDQAAMLDLVGDSRRRAILALERLAPASELRTTGVSLARLRLAALRGSRHYLQEPALVVAAGPGSFVPDDYGSAVGG